RHGGADAQEGPRHDQRRYGPGTGGNRDTIVAGVTDEHRWGDGAFRRPRCGVRVQAVPVPAHERVESASGAPTPAAWMATSVAFTANHTRAPGSAPSSATAAGVTSAARPSAHGGPSGTAAARSRTTS